MTERDRFHPTLSRRRFLASTAATGLLVPSTASAAADPEPGRSVAGSPTLATTDRLADRRYVVSGSRAYVVGTQAGRFPPMGWHIEGEMGGIWSPPLKLLDGVWFALDGEWLDDAERFESGYGHAVLTFPDRGGLSVRRTDFVPDGRRGALFGLDLAAGDAEETVTLAVEARSSLLPAYPWEWTDPSSAEFEREDAAAVEGGRLAFRERGPAPVEGASPRDWAAVVGAALDPASGETGGGVGGPDPDENGNGSGASGRLEYELTIPAGEERTVWVAVAGSDEGLDAALEEHDALLDDPDAALEAKVEERLDLCARTCLDLPGNRDLERAIDWGKQNLADCVQVARDLRVRDVEEGAAYPEPAGTVEAVRFLGAGFPDYPWLFATDGEYTAFASVAVGQFEPIKDHLRALRDVSRILTGDTGKVVHEVVTDGSVYFGTLGDGGNTDETAKFPSALALLWRWTGDDDFRDDLYDFAVDGMRYVLDELDDDGDGWPEGAGNVERPGMGEEKLDVAVYTIRGLYDLADMARSKRDGRTFAWAHRHARRLHRTFEEAWWLPAVPQHADSLTNPDEEPVYQRHWIGVTPMEAELHTRPDGSPSPGLTTEAHGNAALDLRETDCYTGEFGLYHTGKAGCDPAESDRPPELSIFTLNTAIMAVGEGNYGRLGAGHQRRYTDANARLQLWPDEQPGALPEIAPSPKYGRSIDKPFTERAMVLQAWGHYGTVWPVVHQQLGVRPDLGRGRLSVVPQVPPDEPRVAGENVRLGDGEVAVEATADGDAYRTTVRAAVDLDELVIGHTLPEDARVDSVALDGRPAPHRVRETHRGREVLVSIEGEDAGGEHVLAVETRS
ncbi:hypothetical protein [Halomarina pelagica]|uniref:hypothetical protein n=1 Tax=Halomarina pelagica TaxID=2961599 RepID=UPI0020C3C334|nr:hypothetical protein [Halomarina sp. BND7]